MKRHIIILINIFVLVMGLELPLLAQPTLSLSTQESQTISIELEPIIPTNHIDFAPLSIMGQSTEAASAEGTWLVSLLIPGGGQILMGKPERGMLFLSGMVLSLGGMFFFKSNGGSVQNMINGLLASALLGLGVYFWNVLDAYAMNDAINKQTAP